MKQLRACLGQFQKTLRGEGHPRLVFAMVQGTVPHIDTDAGRGQMMFAQFLADLLTEFQQDLPYLIFCGQIRSAGDPMPDAFDGRLIIARHHTRGVLAIGVDPEL